MLPGRMSIHRGYCRGITIANPITVCNFGRNFETGAQDGLRTLKRSSVSRGVVDASGDKARKEKKKGRNGNVTIAGMIFFLKNPVKSARNSKKRHPLRDQDPATNDQNTKRQ